MKPEIINIIPKEHWSIIQLLEFVKKKFVKQTIETIKQNINIGSTYYTYYCAFKNIQCLLRGRDKQFDLVINNLKNASETNFNTIIINNLLENYGHYLFNSYYYVLSEDAEFLIPIVPGMENLNLSRTDFDKKYYEVFQFIINKQLPWRIYGENNSKLFDNIITYSRQKLPLRGGITAHYLYKVIQGKFNKDESYIIHNFLGSLSILHKREDFLAGNVSAIICPLIMDFENDKTVIPASNVIGAFVLTSIVNDAFEDGHKNSLENLFKQVDISKDFLLGLKPNIKYSSANIKTAVYDERKRFLTLDQKTKDTMKQILQSEFCKKSLMLSVSFSDFDQNHNSTDLFFRALGINFENLREELKSLFPATPNLNPKFVSKEGSKQFIDFKKYKNHCEEINNIFSFAKEMEVFTIHKVSEAFKVIVPEFYNENLLISSHIKEINIDSSEYKLFMICDDKNSIEQAEELVSTFKELVYNDSVENPIELPDGENPQFIELEDYWINNYDELWQGNNEINKNPIIINVVKALRPFKFRALFLLKSDKIYLPKNFRELDSTLNTFAGFWYLQNICKVFNQPDYIKLDRFKGESSLDFIPYFEEKPDDFKIIMDKIKVGSDKDEYKKQIKRALNFYGIDPVSFIKAIDRVNDQEANTPDIIFSSIYREYLGEKLKNTNDKSIQKSYKRIFNGEFDQILVNKSADHFTIDFYKNNKKITVEFDEIESYKNELLLFGKEDIKKANLMSHFQHKLTKCCHHNDLKKCANDVVCYYNYVTLGAEEDPFCKDLNNLVTVPNEENTKGIYYSSSANNDMLCDLANDIAFVLEQKNQELLKKEKALKKAWAHTIGNNLRYLGGIANWSKKQIDLILNKNNDDALTNNLFRISKWVHRLERESNLLYGSNEAMYRFEREEIIFNKEENGKYKLESACTIAFFRVFLSYLLKVSDDKKPEYQDYLLPYCGYNPELKSEYEKELRNIEDSEGNLELAKSISTYYRDKIKNYQNYFSLSEQSYSQFVDRCTVLIEKIIDKTENITLNDLVSFLTTPIVNNLKIFDEVNIQIDESFKTNNSVSWSFMGFLFQELWSNTIKYSSPNSNGQRVVTFIIESGEGRDSFLFNNSTKLLFKETDAEDTFGLVSIEMYIAALLGIKKKEELPIHIYSRDNMFVINAIRSYE